MNVVKEDEARGSFEGTGEEDCLRYCGIILFGYSKYTGVTSGQGGCLDGYLGRIILLCYHPLLPSLTPDVLVSVGN